MWDGETVSEDNFDWEGIDDINSKDTLQQELNFSEEEILKELKKATQSRAEANPALQKIFDMREVDPFYHYLMEYDGGEYYRKLKPLILDYQYFNKKIQFYDDDDHWGNKLYTGLPDDIIDMYIEKALTTKLRFFNDSGFKKETDIVSINPLVLRNILEGQAKYGTCLVMASNILEKYDDIIDKDQIIGRVKSGISLNSVKVYPPHMYNIEKEELILRTKYGTIKTLSFAGEKYTEIQGKPILGKKRELIYLLSMIVTNFGIETEIGKMKLHVDERYGSGLSKDVYTVYNSIMSGEVKEFTPLWEMTQGEIRPDQWKKALENILYIISRSVGVDIRGVVYATATQANISNFEDIVKVNSKLMELQFYINKVLSDIMGMKNIHSRFDTFSQDTVDQKLERLQKIYTMGGMLVEDFMAATYELVNLGKPTPEQVVKLKIERNIPLSTQTEDELAMEQDEQATVGE